MLDTEKIINRAFKECEDQFVYEDAVVSMVESLVRWEEEHKVAGTADKYAHLLALGVSDAKDSDSYKRYMHTFNYLYSTLGHAIPNHPMPAEEFRAMHMPKTEAEPINIFGNMLHKI